MLRKVKKQIENEFTEAIDSNLDNQVKELRKAKPKKVIAKKDEKSETKKTVVKETAKK